jgi:cytochrome c oxidase cbb3-type subunit III
MLEVAQRHASWLLILMISAVLSTLGSSAQKAHLPPNRSAATLGTQVFASNCAGCHGLDGRGSERAPGIATNPKVERMTDAQVFQIVSEGIPGTGMPAFHSLTESERQAVVKHLRTLQGHSKTSAVPGNLEEGKSIFFGKAHCADCHMISGQGGFLGSDLSSYGSGKSAQQIRDAILNPAADPDPRRKVAVVVTRDGARLSGMIRNEDNFSLQLQTRDGTFHFFQKSDLTNVERGPQAFMPSDYGEKLSGTELHNLASYLMDVARRAKAVPSAKEDE